MAVGLPTAATNVTDYAPKFGPGVITAEFIHTDEVYTGLIASCRAMEDRLKASLQNYNEHPDVQANLQQLQYDLQSWNLALTTMTNIQKNLADALSSIASNFR